jgi:hypothetical protein
MYVRQLASNLRTTGNNEEFAYAIQLNSIANLVKSRVITTSDETRWAATHISTSSSGDLNVFTQLTQTGNTPTTVFDYEVVSPATLTVSSNSNMGVRFVDGQIKLCSAGCRDCSSGTCVACSSGFVLASSSGLCFACPINCISCSSSNYNLCTGCSSGYFLSGTSCRKCN